MVEIVVEEDTKRSYCYVKECYHPKKKLSFVAFAILRKNEYYSCAFLCMTNTTLECAAKFKDGWDAVKKQASS